MNAPDPRGETSAKIGSLCPSMRHVLEDIPDACLRFFTLPAEFVEAAFEIIICSRSHGLDLFARVDILRQSD
jgi:hypothetical protein